MQLSANIEEFFESSLCGFAIAGADGKLVRVNEKLIAWTGFDAIELAGKKFSDLLSIGGKIYFETHLGPMLRMQGSFEEVALELSTAAGQKMRVLVNAQERRDNDGKPRALFYTVIRATDRMIYEQNLQLAKSKAEQDLQAEKELVLLREQLIAVLGHDLRNPL